MEKNCPCCERHCPVNALHCGRGRAHFGLRDGSAHRREHDNPNDPKVIRLIRRCGKYLHHRVDQDTDTAQLLRALTAEETAALETLLEKCLASWEQQ